MRCPNLLSSSSFSSMHVYPHCAVPCLSREPFSLLRCHRRLTREESYVGNWERDDERCHTYCLFITEMLPLQYIFSSTLIKKLIVRTGCYVHSQLHQKFINNYDREAVVGSVELTSRLHCIMIMTSGEVRSENCELMFRSCVGHLFEDPQKRLMKHIKQDLSGKALLPFLKHCLANH